MLRETVQLIEAHKEPILKYVPKKIGKRYSKRMAEIELWVEAMKYPYEAGYMGHYGDKEGQLEFDVKEPLDYDYEDMLELVGDDDALNWRIEDYYIMGREDLEETLKSEFGCSDFEYNGRSGGYLLIGDYDNAVFGGAGINDISVWYDDNYGETIDEVLEMYDDLEQIISDLTETGPMGEFWDDYMGDLEDLLDQSDDFDTSVKKGATKIIEKNMTKLTKRIEEITSSFGSGFEPLVRDRTAVNA